MSTARTDDEPAPDRAPQPRRKIDDLTAALRAAGVAADVRQREAILDVFSTADALENEQIADVIAVIVAHSARQQQRVHNTIFDWLKRDNEPPPTNEPSRTDVAPPKTPRAEEQAPSLAQLVVAQVQASRTWPLYLVLAPLGVAALGAIATWGLPDMSGIGLSATLPSHLGGIAAETWALVLGGSIAALPIGFMCVRFAEAMRAWRERRRRQHTRGGVLPDGPSLFDFESVGGRTFRFFERRDLQKIARSVPRRRSETPSRRFDPVRTVAATAAAGLPMLLYRALMEPWPIIVLTDRHAPGRQWNNLAADLAVGLANCGLQVMLGSFAGRLDRFDVEELGRVDLTGLMSQDALLLLVGDGSRLSHRGPDLVALRRLADSARAIWIDEREEREWQPRADAPLLAGLPVSPAIPQRIFETLRALGRRSVRQPLPDRRRSSWPGAGLGDALGWAAACAMVQPISVALAHDLRRRFFPHLAAIAFGRLVALQGATLSTDGVRFDDRLLAWLRMQFARRLSKERQNRILDAILKAIEESGEQLPEDSLAHLTWRWHYARVLLERDPDEAVRKLVALEDSPMGDTIRRDLKKVRLPGLKAGSTAIIPMLRLPRYPAEFAGRIAALGLPLGGPSFTPWTLHSLPTNAVHFDSPLVAVAMASEGAGQFVAVLEDGSLRVGTAFSSETAPLLDTASSRIPDTTLLSISPSGQHVAWAGSEGPPRLFTVGPPGRAETFDVQDEQGMSRLSVGVEAMAFYPAEPRLVLALKAEGILSVDLAKGSPNRFAYPGAKFTAVTISSDGGVIALATTTRRIGRIETPETAKALPEWPDSALEVDFEIRALAAGPNGWPLVVAGEDRLVVFAPPSPDAPPERRGPWPIPADTRPQLSLIEEDSLVAVLAAGRLTLLHLETGLDLLKEEVNNSDHSQPTRTHAALGAARNLALVWGEGHRQLLVYAFDNRTAETEEEKLPESHAAPVAA